MKRDGISIVVNEDQSQSGSSSPLLFPIFRNYIIFFWSPGEKQKMTEGFSGLIFEVMDDNFI